MSRTKGCKGPRGGKTGAVDYHAFHVKYEGKEAKFWQRTRKTAINFCNLESDLYYEENPSRSSDVGGPLSRGRLAGLLYLRFQSTGHDNSPPSISFKQTVPETLKARGRYGVTCNAGIEIIRQGSETERAPLVKNPPLKRGKIG